MIDFTLMKTCLLICTKTLLRTLSDVVSRMCGRVTQMFGNFSTLTTEYLRSAEQD